ncbi:Costars domain-containing protein [Mycena kentingensis (nom. inval.)]|nr:Costars domain-containing protein [Mycena kentingensis (nom. inval.)]
MRSTPHSTRSGRDILRYNLGSESSTRLGTLQRLRLHSWATRADADADYSTMNDVEQGDSELDAMWSTYLSRADKFDKALVAGWRADMKGILIFSGLFSAILSAFLVQSYQSLTPDPTVLLLVAISKQLNATVNLPEPSPTSALICNGLWFASLGLSLSSAAVAILVEQWARDFLTRSSDMRPSPVERARISSYLYSGLKQFRVHLVVDLVSFLLHLSLLLSQGGVVAFLYMAVGMGKK